MKTLRKLILSKLSIHHYNFFLFLEGSICYVEGSRRILDYLKGLMPINYENNEFLVTNQVEVPREGLERRMQAD